MFTSSRSPLFADLKYLHQGFINTILNHSNKLSFQELHRLRSLDYARDDNILLVSGFSSLLHRLPQFTVY